MWIIPATEVKKQMRTQSTSHVVLLLILCLSLLAPSREAAPSRAGAAAAAAARCQNTLGIRGGGGSHAPTQTPPPRLMEEQRMQLLERLFEFGERAEVGLKEGNTRSVGCCLLCNSTVVVDRVKNGKHTRPRPGLKWRACVRVSACGLCLCSCLCL